MYACKVWTGARLTLQVALFVVAASLFVFIAQASLELLITDGSRHERQEVNGEQPTADNTGYDADFFNNLQCGSLECRESPSFTGF